MKIEHKICESEVKEFNETDLTVVHWISTESIDRGGDCLHADGMKMDGRVVVLKSHGRDPNIGDEPIGKPVWIKMGTNSKGAKGLLAKTQFYPDEMGKRLWAKTTGGWMPYWSVGWNPIEQDTKSKDGVSYRDVSSWMLYEYSICGVGMQQDAVTPDKNLNPLLEFKLIPGSEEEMETEEKKSGELIGWKITDPDNDSKWIMEEKPYPNEHACRLEDPGKYIRIRRQNDKFGKGIHAIWGVQGGGKPVELQAIRFSKSKFTPKDARAWLKDHDYKCKLFEPASEKCEVCGKEMLIKWDRDVSGEKCGLTCETEFSYVHDGECRKKEEGKEKAETCSCEGEADDKDVCKACKKPKPEKPKKKVEEEKAEMFFVVDESKCAKCGAEFSPISILVDGNTTVKYLCSYTHECKQAEEDMTPDPDSDEDVSFMMVDADEVRKDNETEDFVHGGHHYEFDFIPEPEIWIDQRMTDEDILELKVALFADRQCVKYCQTVGQMHNDMGMIAGKSMRHMVDPMTDGGGNHDENDFHYYEHAGNHWHNRGQTFRWDQQNERYVIHSLPTVGKMTKEQLESFAKDVDEAIKGVVAKYSTEKLGSEKETAINPPEKAVKKVVTVNSEQEKRKSEADQKAAVEAMGRSLSAQIEGAIKKVVPETVKEEFDRLRGRVK